MKDKHSETRFITSVSRHQVMDVLRGMDFVVDVEGNDILILRNSKFPFHRLSLPIDEMISIELIRKYARDLDIPVEYFLP